MQIFRRNHSSCQQFFTNELIEHFPIGASRSVCQDNGDDITFARLNQSEDFHGFVHSSEASRITHHGVTFFNKHELTSEEVLHIHKLMIAIDNCIRRLFEGQHNIEAHRHFPTGAYMTGFHNSMGSSGNNHPVTLSHGSAKVDTRLISSFAGRCSCRTEYCHLSMLTIGSKDFERVSQFT